LKYALLFIRRANVENTNFVAIVCDASYTSDRLAGGWVVVRGDSYHLPSAKDLILIGKRLKECTRYGTTYEAKNSEKYVTYRSRWYDRIIRCSTRTSCVLRYGKFSWFLRGRLAFRNRWVKRRSSISVNFVRACAVECNRLIVLTHIFGNFRQSRDQSALHHARRLVYTV